MNRHGVVRYAFLTAALLVVIAIVLAQTGFLPVRAEFPDERELRVTDCAGTTEGRLDVAVAETFAQKYVGLSRTDSLDAGDGMLFVYDEGGSKTIVMRNMNFALDVLFVSGDGEITKVATLDAPDSLLSYYLLYDSTAGPGQFVVETTAGWSDANDVSTGDCVRGLPT